MAASPGINPVGTRCAAKVVMAFDLDDTLFKERDFACSGYRAVAAAISADALQRKTIAEVMTDALDNRRNPFDALTAWMETNRLPSQLTVAEMVEIYRTHQPHLTLSSDAFQTLSRLKSLRIPLALVSDGRSLTQRNKIDALGLNSFFSDENIFISEEQGFDKTTPFSFQKIMLRHSPECKSFVYVGDNPAKDFIQPNLLGWLTFCLKATAENIHKQPENLFFPHAATVTINKLTDLLAAL